MRRVFRQSQRLLQAAESVSENGIGRPTTVPLSQQSAKLTEYKFHAEPLFAPRNGKPITNRSIYVSLRDGKLQGHYPKPLQTKKGSFPLSEQWLRDHCQCSECVHPVTKQRLIETFDSIPVDVTASSIVEEGNGFAVTWNDGHQSFYTKHWLEGDGKTSRVDTWARRLGWIEPVLWDASTVQDSPPTVDYQAVMASDEGLREWLEKIRVYGFCYVENMPVSPDETQTLLERIAYIRNTHYGGFWDFTSDLSKGDTAYTQLGIGPHTDNTYFSDPAGLQLFHLLSHTGGEGGASTLVDGFAAARALWQEDRGAYSTLSRVRLYSHASGNEDSSIQPYQGFPVLDHGSHSRILTQVRWNTTDRAQIDMPIHLMDTWYDAARKWAKMIKRYEFTEQLRPGKALIFDNWRVLHARTAFTGKRRMCGGYINHDDFISRFKMLQYGREEVLKQVSRWD